MGRDSTLPEDVFERFAEEYDRWFEEHRAEYHAELARVRRLLPCPDSRAIEVGVGSGRFAAPLGIMLGGRMDLNYVYNNTSKKSMQDIKMELDAPRLKRISSRPASPNAFNVSSVAKVPFVYKC